MGGPEAGASPAKGAIPDPAALFRAQTAAIHESAIHESTIHESAIHESAIHESAIHETIDRVCTLLVEPTPEHLDRSAELLAQAVTRLAACRQAPPAPSRSGSAAVETRQLQTALARARRLLEASAAFHAGWVRCAGALCAGYTRGGQPGALAPHSRLQAEG